MKIDISKEDSEYMYDIIQKIIDDCGPRMPCSPQEAKSAEIIKKELEQTCNEVEIEPFSCHPRAFLGYIRIMIFLLLSSFFLFFLLPLDLFLYWQLLIVSLIFIITLLAFMILWNEFFNYREFIDPLFKKRNSQNVVGKIKPKGELKRIVIFSGHHDSALQFNLLKYLRVLYPIIIFVGIFVLLIWLILSGLFLILAFFNIPIFVLFRNVTVWLIIIGIFPLVALFFFVTPGEAANKVPGAVDNLSAVAIVLGMGRYLKKHEDIIPNNTEIRLISFGCEEAGLRGAYRYVEAHLDELKKYDAQCVNMDAIQSVKNIAFCENEPTTRTKHSKIVVQKLIKAAELVEVKVSASGLGGSSKLEKIFGQITGGTDAATFSKVKIKASSIMAIDLLKMAKFYHQPSDTPDKIEKGVLEKVLKILIGFLIGEKNVKI